MINKILVGLFSVIINLINILLTPIDTLITNSLPSVATAISYVDSLIDYIISVIGYAVDLSLLSSFAIGLITAYYVFVLSVPLVIYVIKLALRWYNALKP